MWQYRSAIIFGAALLFALRTVILADAVSLAATTLFLTSHYLDRFFSAERAEKRLDAKLFEFEQQLAVIRTDLSGINVAVGIRRNNR